MVTIGNLCAMVIVGIKSKPSGKRKSLEIQPLLES